jgi:phosphoserine aminotransferase
MSERVFNFFPGPATLPLAVLEQAQREMLSLPGLGMSVLEISHRDPGFLAILQSAKARVRRLLAVPDRYRILFLQGGSRLQFSMVPMNLLRGSGRTADYVLTGSWGKMALDEARREGKTRVAWNGNETGYDRVPPAGALDLDPDAAYVHVTSNETIEGVQFSTEVDSGEAPLVCDASSDFLSRPLPIDRYGLIYACAQKNAGPSGVTIVILREDLLERCDNALPGYLNYRGHAENDSLFNTPPTFAVYIVDLVCRWLEDEVGGLRKIAERNRAKAKLLYDAIDESGGFFRGHAQPESRSLMNVTFRLPNKELEKGFLAAAEERKLIGLKGHRSVGGIRASIYNAMPIDGVERLAEHMRQFRNRSS